MGPTIEIIPPLKCPQCKSTSVISKKGSIHCDECKVITKPSGDKEKIKTYSTGKGRNPWCDTGNYLE